MRVYDPFPFHTENQCGSGQNGSGTITNLNIDAAILAVTGSFIVDNYDCAGSLGNLTVNGAIAQFYRGPVGTTNGNGYTKNYNFSCMMITTWRILKTPFTSIVTAGKSDVMLRSSPGSTARNRSNPPCANR